MPVLQTTIRDCRLKSLDVTYSQRYQQREMNKYFITSGCRTGVVKQGSVRDLGRDHFPLNRWRRTRAPRFADKRLGAAISIGDHPGDFSVSLRTDGRVLNAEDSLQFLNEFLQRMQTLSERNNVPGSEDSVTE